MPHSPIFIKFKGLYIPTNLSDNNLRHFGLKSHKILFLQIQEVLYLISKDLKDLSKDLFKNSVKIRAYFELKNNGFNVLPTKIQYENNDNYDYFFNILNFKDLNCSKVLKKFTKEEIFEIKRMENKINEFIKNEKGEDRDKGGGEVEGRGYEGEDNNNLDNSILDSDFLIYKKTKNFKRSDEPLGKLKFINKNEKVRDNLEKDLKMICLLSENDFIFLDVQKIEKLSFGLDPRLRKKKGSKGVRGVGR